VRFVRGSWRRIGRKLGLTLLLGGAALGGVAGCYAEAYPAYPVSPQSCVAVWVPGSYGPYGQWYPGHWRCA
jgi:hypothetical protein